MLNPDFTIFPTLFTDRLILKEITPNDAEALYSMRSNPEIMKYIDRSIPSSVKDIIELIEKMDLTRKSGDGISWSMFKKDNPQVMIGNIGLFKIMKENYRAEIGYMLNTDEQQKGIMYEAIQRVIEYGFKEINLHSMEANINPANEASRKLLQKAGFVKEAYFRENFFYDGIFLDSEIYSLLNKD